MSRRRGALGGRRGEDVNGRDRFERTPLHARATHWKHWRQIPLLLLLGAEVDAEDHEGGTPLVMACEYHRSDAVEMLLAAGADPNHQSHPLMVEAEDPLSVCLLREDNFGLASTVEIVEILLAAGAVPTEAAVEPLRRLGHDVERAAAASPTGGDPERRRLVQRLYEVFGVEPVAPIHRHDGTSDIVVPDGEPSAQYRALWDSLVPDWGEAPTLQGEAVRLVGRLGHEVLDNGGGNWDRSFKAMTRQLGDVLGRGHALPPVDLAEALSVLDERHTGWAEPERVDVLTALVVEWVRLNPTAVPNDLPGTGR